MLSTRVKALRKANNLTQVDFAGKLSVAKQTVSNWENDNIQPSIEMLVKIADLFGVTTDYILGRDSAPRLDVSGLTEREIQHINMVVNDIRQNK